MGWLRATVEGRSMVPALAPGDRLLVRTGGTPARGDVVVVRASGLLAVKRLAGLPGDRVGQRRLGPDEWWVAGDNAAASTDSRHYGPVTREALVGRAVLRYRPRPGRVR